MLTGAASAENLRTELLLGVGGKPPHFAGALRSGQYKLIAPTSQADGWSAQYAGSTPYIHSIAGAGTCTTKPCLFDLSLDPRETKDLSEQEPDKTSQLFTRYKQLATELYAPNANTDDKTATLLAAAITARSSHRAVHSDRGSAADGNRMDVEAEVAAIAALEEELALPSACADDACWERRTHELQLRQDALLNSSPFNSSASCADMAQITGKHWFLGAAGDIFAFTNVPARGSNALAMSIVAGCSGCKFTRGDGSLDTEEMRMTIVASGKGVNYTHTATISLDATGGQCRLHWGDNWRDFCQGSACVGPPSPPPHPHPHPKGGKACEKMLTDGGFWQPWQQQQQLDEEFGGGGGGGSTAAAKNSNSGGDTPPVRPKPTLRFSAKMRIGEAYGHDGDGCVAAEKLVSASPVISEIAFDSVKGRLRQSNMRLEKAPKSNVTSIGRWDLQPPKQWSLTTMDDGTVSCSTAPLQGTFGTWGALDPFTSILGMYLTCSGNQSSL